MRLILVRALVELDARVDAPLLEQGDRDLRLRLKLEDPVVPPLRERPQRRSDRELVGRDPLLVDAGLASVRAEALPGSIAGSDRLGDLERRVLPDERAEVEIDRGGHDLELDGEQLLHRFPNSEAAHIERLATRDLHRQVGPREHIDRGLGHHHSVRVSMRRRADAARVRDQHTSARSKSSTPE
jgi:hypothetical protein